MPKYRLTRAADDDISQIYSYTYRAFGEAQANAYLESLETALIRLGDRPDLGVDVGQLRKGYRRLVHREHAIYYRKSKHGVLVVRVLGPGMAAERQIP